MTRPVDGDTATFGDVILSYSLVLVAERSAPVFWLWGVGLPFLNYDVLG